MDEKQREKETKKIEQTKENLKKSIKKEEIEIKKGETEEKKLVDEYVKDLQRVQAEFENYVKRVNKEKEQIMHYTKESMVLKFLEVLDNFERALSIEDANIEQLKKGIDLIHKQFQKTIFDEGVKSFDSLDEPFDPEKHEAMMFEEHDTENKVIEEFQKGYLYHDRILRPAKVKVSKKKTEAEK